MDKLYSIQESTLTDIGDALRGKYGETRIEIERTPPFTLIKSSKATDFNIYGGYTGPSTAHVFKCPGASYIKLVYTTNINEGIGHYIKYAIGEYTKSTFPTDATVLENTTEPKTITIEADVITIRVHDSSWKDRGYYIQATGYDANDNPIELESSTIIEKEVEVKNTYGSADVAAAIDGIDTAALFKESVNGTMTTITEEDLAGEVAIKEYSIAYRQELTSVELPDSIMRIEPNAFYCCRKLANVKMPHNDLLSLYNQAFKDCAKLASITLYETPPIVTDSTFDTRYLKNIYVPGYAYDNYLATNYFNSTYFSLLTPNSSYVGQITGPKVLTLNLSYNFSIPLLCFDEAPTNYSIVPAKGLVSQGGAFCIVDVNATNTEITFVVAAAFEEEDTIIATVEDADGNVFTREFAIKSYETVPETTYSIEDVEGASYGFILNDAGYYESTNQKKANSAAVCKVNISNAAGRVMYIDLINNGEANYDYGLFSQPDKALTLNNTDDGADSSLLVKYNFKGKSSTNVVTISYDNVIGDCFIYVKYKKDSGGDQGNDSLQFRIRFE